jgi:multiple sugar transport system permease protein
MESIAHRPVQRVRMHSLRQLGSRGFPYWLLLPAVLILGLVVAYPLGYSFSKSLTNLHLTSAFNESVGVRNYQEIFSDHQFWNSAKLTAIFVVFAVALETVIGYWLATVLARLGRARRFLLPAVLLPMMVTPVVMGLMWKYMLSEDFGVINWLFSVVGLPTKDWLSEPSTALPTLITIDVWMWTPFMALIFLAGILALPREPYEAAAIDGAGRWLTFRMITMPLLRKVIVVALLLRTVDALQTLDVLFVTTKGGPGIKTELLSYYSYKQGFEFFNMGYALALSWVLVAVTLVIAVVYTRFMPKRRSQIAF